jgi:hypothetical protein
MQDVSFDMNERVRAWLLYLMKLYTADSKKIVFQNLKPWTIAIETLFDTHLTFAGYTHSIYSKKLLNSTLLQIYLF